MFVSSIQQLQDTVGRYLTAVDAQAARIEAEKLRAVGLRNRVAALHEVRRAGGAGRLLPLLAAAGAGRARVGPDCRVFAQGRKAGGFASGRAPDWPAAAQGAQRAAPRLSSLPHHCRAPQERRRRRQELQQLLTERQEELDRLLAEEESLQRVVKEQELAVAKLSDPGGA